MTNHGNYPQILNNLAQGTSCYSDKNKTELKKIMTVELLGGFHVYGGYYLSAYLITSGNLHVQCLKINW